MRKATGVAVTAFLAVLLGAGPASVVNGQQVSSGLSTTPQFVIPIGTRAENYNYGVGGTLEGLFSSTGISALSLGIDAGYTFVPLATGQPYFSTDTYLSLVRLGAAIRVGLPFGDRVSLFVRGAGGGFAGLLSGSAKGNAFGLGFSAGGGFSFLLGNQLAVQAGVSYDSYVGLFDGLTVSIGMNTRFSGSGSVLIPREDFVPIRREVLPGGGDIEFVDADLIKVFPVLYKYYASHPIGSMRVVNSGDSTLNDVELRFETAQFMDAPLLSARIDHMEPGEEQTVDIYGLFTEAILSVTEGTVLAGEMRANYTVDGNAAEDVTTLTLEIWNRNAIRWDDDSKVAAFVTAHDEEIQRTARNVASIVRDEGLASFSRELQLAIALFGMMDVFGCAYVVDPASSYAELSGNAAAVDSVQFPRQTLQYRAGDCDDLSSTYNALLEAVGVETAFITVPGHIYAAFRLDMEPERAGRTFSRSDDLIYTDQEVWVPVETTTLSGGFLNAWALGARQWREHEADGNAVLIPVRQAWETYEPVAFGVSTYELEIPDRDEVAYLFSAEFESFIGRELDARERPLLARIDQNPDDRRALNSLGVLYAQYGLFDDARARFEAAIPTESAYVNLGNLAYLSEDYAAAEQCYQDALAVNPESAGAILGLAKVAYAIEQFDQARDELAQLARMSPVLAERYAYLGGGASAQGRASDVIDLGAAVEWAEE